MSVRPLNVPAVAAAADTEVGGRVVATEPVVAPPPGHPRFPLLDSMRAIAALSVLLTHTGFLSGVQATHWWGHVTERLEMGVCIFFLISGYLLYRPFVSARLNGARRTRIGAYARRRILRIVPAYWVALTVLAIYPGLPVVFTDQWWVYYGFLQIYSPSHVLNGIGPAWTLCVEISFYAVLPLYAWLVARGLRDRSRRTQVRSELVVLALLAAVSLALRYYLRDAQPFSTLQNTLLTHLDWFAAGMALAVVSAALQGSPRRPRWLEVVTRWPWVCWLGALAALAVVSFGVHGVHYATLPHGVEIAYYHGYEDALRHVLYAICAALLLAPAIFGDGAGGGVRRLLATRWLAWLGLISYGIYLWQMPILVKAQGHLVTAWSPAARFAVLTVVPGAVVIAASAASYYAVERPLLRFKDRRRA